MGWRANADRQGQGRPNGGGAQIGSLSGIGLSQTQLIDAEAGSGVEELARSPTITAPRESDGSRKDRSQAQEGTDRRPGNRGWKSQGWKFRGREVRIRYNPLAGRGGERSCEVRLAGSWAMGRSWQGRPADTPRATRPEKDRPSGELENAGLKGRVLPPCRSRQFTGRHPDAGRSARPRCPFNATADGRDEIQRHVSTITSGPGS